MNTGKLITVLVLLPFGLAPAGQVLAQSPQELHEATTLLLEQQHQLVQQHAAADRELREAEQNVREVNRRRAESQDLNRQSQQMKAEALVQAERTALEAARTSDAALAAFDPRTGTAILTSGDGKRIRLQQIVGRSHVAEQSQVIAFSAMDPVKRAELIEDLNVMSKLIDDGIADQRDPAAPRAMGISVAGLFPDSSTPRSLFIEGYGALFQATVRFPLKPSEKKDSATDPKPAKNSPWDEARRELYGSREEEPVVWIGSPEGRAEEYSDERVETLKKNVLKALGNASNFRHVGRDETITVAIRSGSGGGRRVALPPATTRSATSGSSAHQLSTGVTHWEAAGGAGEPTTMTIRIKKSDADELAKGAFTEDEFRKRAVVTVY